MLFRTVIGSAIGLLAGAAIGYFLKSRGGTCPLTCNPYGGAIVGALFGGLIAGYVRPRGDLAALAQVPPAATVEQFDRALAAEKPVLVDFYTKGCGPCAALAPRIAKLAREYEGKIGFLKVDLREVPALAERYGIRSVPTIMLLAGGRESRRWVGLTEEQVFRSALDEASSGATDDAERATP